MFFFLDCVAIHNLCNILFSICVLKFSRKIQNQIQIKYNIQLQITWNLIYKYTNIQYTNIQVLVYHTFPCFMPLQLLLWKPCMGVSDAGAGNQVGSWVNIVPFDLADRGQSVLYKVTVLAGEMRGIQAYLGGHSIFDAGPALQIQS